MIELLIHGGNAKQRRLVKKAINFCIEKLLPSTRSLHLEIVIKDIEDYGSVVATNGYNHLYMELNRSQAEVQLLETTMHEMVHVKQYIKKDWTTYYTKCFWKGKDYTKTCYSQQPWERQAYRMQGKLLKQFLSSQRTKRKNNT